MFLSFPICPREREKRNVIVCLIWRARIKENGVDVKLGGLTSLRFARGQLWSLGIATQQTIGSLQGMLVMVDHDVRTSVSCWDAVCKGGQWDRCLYVVKGHTNGYVMYKHHKYTFRREYTAEHTHTSIRILTDAYLMHIQAYVDLKLRQTQTCLKKTYFCI